MQRTRTYEQRATDAVNATTKKLLQCVIRKKSNLSIAADVLTKNELLSIANNLGPYICLLKTHIDMICDFDIDLIIQLQHLSQKHDFLIFEDRKFADIGNTVKHQYRDGIYQISSWADIINAHSVPGLSLIVSDQLNNHLDVQLDDYY